MNRHRQLAEIASLKRGLKAGRSNLLLGNIAVAYRALGNRRRAFEWWRRAAGPHDGDSFVEVRLLPTVRNRREAGLGCRHESVQRRADQPVHYATRTGRGALPSGGCPP